MSNSNQKFYLDDSFTDSEKEEKLSEEVVNIRDLFRLLSAEDKIKVRGLLTQENIF